MSMFRTPEGEPKWQIPTAVALGIAATAIAGCSSSSTGRAGQCPSGWQAPIDIDNNASTASLTPLKHALNMSLQITATWIKHRIRG